MLDSTLFSHCPIGISYYGIETPLICVVTWFTKLGSSQGCFRLIRYNFIKRNEKSGANSKHTGSFIFMYDFCLTNDENDKASDLKSHVKDTFFLSVVKMTLSAMTLLTVKVK